MNNTLEILLPQFLHICTTNITIFIYLNISHQPCVIASLCLTPLPSHLIIKQSLQPAPPLPLDLAPVDQSSYTACH